MADDRKPTIAEFARAIKQANPSLENVPDEVLARKVFERRPDLIDRVQTSEARPKSAGEQHGAAYRFGEGMASPLHETAEYFKGGLKHPFGQKLTPGEQQALFDEIIKNKAKNMGPHGVGAEAKAIFGVPGIAEEFRKGNTAGASGRATTEALMWALPFMRGGKAAVGTSALDEVTGIGRGMKVDQAALEAAKNISADVAGILDKQIESIDQGMAGQFVNVKTLQANIDRAVKMMDNIEKAPSMQVKDVSAAKDVVSRLADHAKQGTLTWKDAREFYKEIGNARTTVKGASGVRTALDQISDALDTQLRDTAKAAGKEAEYNKWSNDYRDLMRWQRGYAKTVKGQTAQQMEAKASATPGVRIPKTNITLGGSDKAGKVAKGQIKTAHKALEELRTRVRTSPSGIKPPSPSSPAPGAGGQPGGGQPPVGSPSPAGPSQPQGPAPTSGPAGPVTPGSGTFARDPQPNPVERGPQPAPILKRPRLPQEEPRKFGRG